MRRGTLVPDIAEVELVSLGRVAGMIEMRLRTCRVGSTCSACGTSSQKVHSRYERRLADLPWDGVPVVIRLQTRRFFCVEPACRLKVFTELLPGTVARYGRRSCRSGEALRCLTLALGGRAGARLAERLGLLASRSTLLREIHHDRPAALVQAPRMLGIDDWAWRKGHRYGTILCDLETRKVVDLLPDRDTNSVATWLRQHPGTEIISRDRGGIYAEAACPAAPQALEALKMRFGRSRNAEGKLRLTRARRPFEQKGLLELRCEIDNLNHHEMK